MALGTSAPTRTAAVATVRPARRRSGGRIALLRAAAIVGLLLVWEVVVDLTAPDSPFFAAPSRIVTEGLPVFADSDVQAALVVTATRFGIAFLITAVSGIAIGLVIGRATRVAPVARNVAVVLYSVPQVAFYPLFIVWFGLGPAAEIAFGVSHGVVPVVLLTMAAAAGVDRELLEASAAMGARRWQGITAVVLPASLPAVVGALRVGASLSLLGVLLAELLVSVDGVGGVINQLAGTLQAARLDALLLGVSAAAVVLNVVVGAGERMLGRSRGSR